MPDSVLILGGTDVTLAVAEAVVACGIRVSGIVAVGDTFSISYNKAGVANMRGADIDGWAKAHGVAVLPFNGYDEILAKLPERPALCLVAGWYHMVPAKFRALFPRGCLGFHASLLPQLRGGAPLNWAILNGLERTGVSLFALSDGVDEGLVYGQSAIEIAATTAIGELVEQSRACCAALVRDHLPAVLSGEARGRPQQGIPSYGLQRIPADSWIDWREPAEAIDRLVRASSQPYGGAYTFLDGSRITIWAGRLPSEAPDVSGAPGQIIRLAEVSDVCVVTGSGLLAVVKAADADGNDALDLLRRSSHKRFRIT